MQAIFFQIVRNGDVWTVHRDMQPIGSYETQADALAVAEGEIAALHAQGQQAQLRADPLDDMEDEDDWSERHFASTLAPRVTD